MEKEFRVRFAPSPTGYLHIGGVRTALFNYYAARHYKGKFILRIEDTDKERSTKESVNNMLESLKWLNISWDEGPFYQSKRIEIYKKYLKKLLDEKKAYYCFCTKEELDRKREKMLAMKKPPVYDGTCRNLTEKEIKEKLKINPNPTVRFKVPHHKIIKFKDIVRGELSFNTDLIGDFIIFKSDNTPSYNFAVVIDDALMKISHIIRGEDHISNTPRQIMLYEALNFPIPEFAHTSLILNPDHTKLSKREKATSLLYLKEEGYLMEAIKNYVALLGWSPPDTNELLEEDKLISLFSFERLSRSPAIYDLNKLNWINGKYIRNYSNEKLLKLGTPFLIKYKISDENNINNNKEWFLYAIESIKDNLTTLKDIVKYIQVYFKEIKKIETINEEDFEYINIFLKAIKEIREFSLINIRKLLRDITKTINNKKHFYHLIREILTNSDSGPQLDYIIYLYGKEKVLNILNQYMKGE